MPPGVLLCACAVPANREHTADEQEADRHHGTQIPANHEKPDNSQYPPGYLLVTSMAVTHFGFL